MMRRSPVACLCHVSPPPLPSPARSSASAAILFWFPLDVACARLPLFVLLLHGIVLHSGRPAPACCTLLPRPLPLPFAHTIPLDCAMEPWPLSSSSPSSGHKSMRKFLQRFAVSRVAVPAACFVIILYQGVCWFSKGIYQINIIYILNKFVVLSVLKIIHMDHSILYEILLIFLWKLIYFCWDLWRIFL